MIVIVSYDLIIVVLEESVGKSAIISELIKHPQYSPLRVDECVMTIYIGTSGYLDSLEHD